MLWRSLNRQRDIAAATVTWVRAGGGGRRIAMRGNSAPMVNDTAEGIATSLGCVNSSGSGGVARSVP